VYRLFLSLGLTASLATAADLFPLDQVRAGMRGTGHTVFSGERVEARRSQSWPCRRWSPWMEK